MNDSTRAAAQQPDTTALRAEADWLHRCLFRAPVDEPIASRYVRAHQHLQLRTGVDVARIVERRLDAEAIELFARRRSPDNPLTQKLRTLLYLCEIDARYYDRFVRHRGSMWSALPALAISPLRSLWKLVKGRALARRHDVA